MAAVDNVEKQQQSRDSALVILKRARSSVYSYPSFFFNSYVEKYRNPWLSTIDSTNKPPTIPKTIRGKWSSYQSFFMNFKTIPTNKWSCTSRDSNEQWTCDTSSIDRG